MSEKHKKISKPFILANVRKLDIQFNAGEISYSRMVEIMNEMADEYANEKIKSIVNHHKLCVLSSILWILKNKTDANSSIVEVLNSIIKQLKLLYK